MQMLQLDEDDSQRMIKEVTVITAAVGALAKLGQIFISKGQKDQKSKRKTLEERVSELEETNKTLSDSVPAIQEHIKEVKEDNKQMFQSLSQIINEISGVRADLRQTNVNVAQIRNITDATLTMSHREVKSKEELKQLIKEDLKVRSGETPTGENSAS